MKPPMRPTNAPTATTPPSQVRRQLTCALAFTASVAIGPAGTDGTMVPRGVTVGVAVAAWCATRWT